MYDLNKKLTVARQRGFTFNQINKLTTKIYSNLSHIYLQFYLKHRIPTMHLHFFETLFQNPKYIEIFCNNLKNPFLFACRKWYLNDQPQC